MSSFPIHGASHGASDDEFAELRRDMVERQLRGRGIHDERVLAAMGRVPRESFVPPEQRALAYSDRALPLGMGQTVSQPYTVAFMCQALQLAAHETVLEIGTGSGYAAAVLSYLAAHVYTIERLEPLAQEARQRLRMAGCYNVAVTVSDGTLGLPEHAPYDAIVVTAGGVHLPQPLADQLGEGGRLVIPLGTERDAQIMWRFTRRDGRLTPQNLGRFAFVPLVGELGWNPED
jgi:protein-L-isoaspartate(D-aspartate) O-methyltransferase